MTSIFPIVQDIFFSMCIQNWIYLLQFIQSTILVILYEQFPKNLRNFSITKSFLKFRFVGQREKIILGSLNSSHLATHYLYLVKHEQCLHLKYRIATGFDMSNLCVNKFLVLICLLVLLQQYYLIITAVNDSKCKFFWT